MPEVVDVDGPGGVRDHEGVVYGGEGEDFVWLGEGVG